jgi:hypothetical protein
VKGRLDEAAVAGVTDDVVATPPSGTVVGVGPSELAATVGEQSALVPPVVPLVVPPEVGVVVLVVPPHGVVIDAMVVGVRLAAPAEPVNPDTMTSEVTAIPDPMINRLAHISVALLSVEAQPLRTPNGCSPDCCSQPVHPIMARDSPVRNDPTTLFER